MAASDRNIDTAQACVSEADVGEGPRVSGLPHDQIFLATKILTENFGANAI